MEPQSSGARFALLAMGITGFVAIVLGIIFDYLGSASSLGRWVLVAATAVAIVGYAIVTFAEHTVSQPLAFGNIGEARVPRTEDIGAFFDEKGEGLLTFSQAYVFVQAIAYPRGFFRRISENAQPFHRSLHIESTYSVHIDEDPDEGSMDYVVPLFLFEKERIQDGLRLSDESGRRLSSLSSQDIATFAAAVVRALMSAAGVAAYEHYLRDVEARALLAIVSNGVPDSELNEIENLMSMVPGDPGREGLADTAFSVVSDLTKWHPICVSVPADKVLARQWPHVFRFKMEYRTIPPIQVVGGETFRQKLETGARLLLGVRLNRLFIPLVNDLRTPSYHLQVSGPEGTYLSKQGTIPVESSLDLDARVQPRQGQRRAHLYVRRRRTKDDAWFAAHFFERSPGSFASTTASAWAAAVVVTLLALHETQQQLQPVTSILPALLAVPIAVATWSGFDAARTARHPSLLSRTLTILTIVLSLTAFAFAVLPENVFEASDTLWTLVSAVGIALALVSSISWVLRLAVENHFSRRGDQAE